MSLPTALRLDTPHQASLHIPADFLLSVVIPVYNEERWVREVVRRVEAAPIPKEIILIDDASTDGTRAILQELEGEGYKVVYQETNQGKGAALRVGFQHAQGDIILIQDADLEYDPADYPRLIAPLLQGQADVVFGSRYLGDCRRVQRFWHTLANKILTISSNMFTNLNLSDMETCYKVFRREVLEGLTLRSNRFGFEPEFTAKIARRDWRIFELPVSYAGRSRAQGKKIGVLDAVQAFYCIVRYSLWD